MFPLHPEEGRATLPLKKKLLRYRGASTLLLVILAFYVAIRLVAWDRTVLLEDHDSVGYLKDAKAFLSLDLNAINDLSPDSAPFYPFTAALFSLPGWSVETGARLSSLIFSLVLFICLLRIGGRLDSRSGTSLGMIILSISPVFVFLSISVLSEPAYIALVYIGFSIFLSQYEHPSLWRSALLGITYGFAFLARTEGFLFVAIIPGIQGAHFLLSRRKKYRFSKLVAWSFVFVLSFSVLAVPQIWRVSNKMGRIAINGRQAWMAVLNSRSVKSPEEKIRGLDYSPSQINLRYVQSHPEALAQLDQRRDLKHYKRIAWTFINNFREFYQNRLGILVGPVGVFLFFVGLFAIYRSGRKSEAILVVAFVGLNLIAPFLANVVIRHIAIVAPIMFLVEGIGVVYLYKSLPEAAGSPALMRATVILLLAMHLTLGSVFPIKGKLSSPPRYSFAYSPAELKEPLRIIKENLKKQRINPITITARKGFLSYFADCKYISIPYTTYEGLVKYCQLNDVDFVFLQHRLISVYPFLDRFSENDVSPHFILLYRSDDRVGKKIELYRFNKTSDGQASEGTVTERLSTDKTDE